MKKSLKKILFILIGLLLIGFSMALAFLSCKLMYEFFQIILFGANGNFGDILVDIVGSVLCGVYSLIIFIAGYAFLS